MARGQDPLLWSKSILPYSQFAVVLHPHVSTRHMVGTNRHLAARVEAAATFSSTPAPKKPKHESRVAKGLEARSGKRTPRVVAHWQLLFGSQTLDETNRCSNVVTVLPASRNSVATRCTSRC